jgi:hypothetical protein
MHLVDSATIVTNPTMLGCDKLNKNKLLIDVFGVRARLEMNIWALASFQSRFVFNLEV